MRLAKSSAAVIACTFAVAGAPHAHSSDDALSAWLRTLHARDGSSCCHDRDCAPSDARLERGQWEVPRGDGAWEAIGPERVLTTPNRDGRPILCRLPSGVIVCFVPPAGA